MKGIIGKVAAILGMMTFLAACSPAAAPHGGRSTANRVADTAKTAGKQGRHTVGQAARGITRDVKKLPGKAMHGTRRLAREGSHTAKKLGMGGRGRTAASGSVRGGFAAGTAPALKVIGFVTTDNTKGPNGSPGLDYLARTPDAVTYLSPLFYAVEKDGSLRSHYVAGVVAFARAHRIKVMPLINNAGGNHAFLDDPKARDNAVKNIADMVNARHFDGVSIDFQLLPDTSRVSLNTFMDELSGRLRPLHKIITINVIPTQAQTGDHGAYDEHTLARYADQLILMSYDRHNDSSSPGPVSPHDWVVQAVTHALQQGVPAAKIYLGVNTP